MTQKWDCLDIFSSQNKPCCNWWLDERHLLSGSYAHSEAAIRYHKQFLILRSHQFVASQYILLIFNFTYCWLKTFISYHDLSTTAYQYNLLPYSSLHIINKILLFHWIQTPISCFIILLHIRISSTSNSGPHNFLPSLPPLLNVTAYTYCIKFTASNYFIKISV